MLNIELDANFIDISQLTYLNIRRKELQSQGLNLLDLPKIRIDNIISQLSDEILFPIDQLDNIKLISNAENRDGVQLTMCLNELDLSLRKRINFKRMLQENTRLRKKLENSSSVYFSLE